MRLRTQARKAVTQVWEPFQSYGHMKLGEAISQQEHALQSAWFAQQDGASDELIIASLLHDIGHLLTWNRAGLHPEESGENGYHEKVGAQFLSDYFDDDITKPIRLHVAAKRYLASKDETHYQTLSEASKQSLTLQGGLMTESTCSVFESSPWYDSALKLRQYDDRAKVQNMKVPSIDAYFELLIQHTRIMKERTIHV